MAAKTMRQSNGRSDLNIALASLIQNQAHFVAQMERMNQRHDELKKASDERFARIEALLLEHNRLLKALPDAIKEKIGFQKN